jgi:hypothetical protein
MKWYRSTFDKLSKRTKYGFSNPTLPYIDDKLNTFFNESLPICGFVESKSDDYFSYSSNRINYNIFDEDFLLENINNYSDILTYNIISNEILIKYDEKILLYSVNESKNLFNYCSQLISCLQYDRRISATISGNY